MARTNRGNIAFGRDVVFEKLWRLYVRGWKFYKTRLSESYSYSDFLGERPADSIEIAVLTAEGHFEFLAAMHEREPRAGETLIYFAPGRDPSAQENGNDKRESSRT
ncbi:MAG: hypothetical protein AAFZ58_12670 [Pseudomonadota bacterium]